MKSNVYIIIALSLLINVHISAVEIFSQPLPSIAYKAKETSSLKLSYCNDSMNTAIGAGANFTVKVGIHFPASLMKLYKGNQLSRIRVGLGLGSLLNAKVFLSVSKDSVPFYTQNVSFQNSTWNEIVLNVPYTITNKDLFIGYQITSGSTNYYPIGIDKGPAQTNSGWIQSINAVGTSSSWFSLSDIGYDANITLEGIVEGNSLPANCALLKGVAMPGYVKPNQKFSIDVSLKNLGTNTITSANLVLKKNNSTLNSIQLSNINLASNQSAVLKSDSIEISELGEFTLYAMLNTINTSPNVYVDSLSAKISVTNNFFRRKVVLEHFSTAVCPNCPAGHERVNAAILNRPDVMEIVHHTGYSTDAFTIPESTSYLWFYNAGTSTYAPALMLDRTNMYAYGASNSKTTTPVFSVGMTSEINKLINARFEKPAFVSVNIDNSFNLATRQLTVNVSGEKVKDLTRDNGAVPKMFVFLVEDSLLLDQIAPGSVTLKNYQHDNVVRDLISNILWGSAVTFNASNAYYLNYTYAVPANWNEKHLKLIAFLGYQKITDTNLCDILNANSTKLNFSATGLQPVFEQIKLKVTGNKITLLDTFNSLSVYNMQGQLIQEIPNGINSFEISPSGIYLIKALTNDGVKTTKVSIKD